MFLWIFKRFANMHSWQSFATKRVLLIAAVLDFQKTHFRRFKSNQLKFNLVDCTTKWNSCFILVSPDWNIVYQTKLHILRPYSQGTMELFSNKLTASGRTIHKRYYHEVGQRKDFSGNKVKNWGKLKLLKIGILGVVWSK